MCEKLKNTRTRASEICNLEFGDYPFIKDKMTIQSSMHERAQEYLTDKHYNNYKHPPLQPNANSVQIHPRVRLPAVIETKTPSKSYREAVCGNKGEDAMSISLKHNPISTTSLITGGSPNLNKSELTELKTEISGLYTQMTGFQTLMTTMLEATKAREEVDQKDRLEREKREREDKIEKEKKDRELQVKIMKEKEKDRAHQVYMEQQAQACEDKLEEQAQAREDQQA